VDTSMSREHAALCPQGRGLSRKLLTNRVLSYHHAVI